MKALVGMTTFEISKLFKFCSKQEEVAPYGPGFLLLLTVRSDSIAIVSVP